ncbi:hypothetical protein [Streptomyces sp. TBY4]|uniref:hypothetical protein n=1 Tax=Streptomyces sp. TBY4 TaxID=2962030 RepID=UPI0020B8EAE2|nr:hypothetical protein [Streptomyces sp. TBY4]MCP3755924.1 hypothetical protein [Streptomyces sp. TBY4]
MSAQQEPAAPAGPPARSGAAAAIGWILTIGFNVVAPVLTYNMLTDRGWSEFGALLVSGGWPVVDSLVHLAWRRKVDEFAVVTLVFLVITALVTLIGPRRAWRTSTGSGSTPTSGRRCGG